MAVFLFLFLLLTSLYIGWVIWLIGQWRKLSSTRESITDASHFSIIIPFRNESIALQHLIQTLQPNMKRCNQIEIIFVNDHSTDDSVKIVTEFQRRYPEIKLLHQTDTFGKKRGVDLGVQSSLRTWIVALDADTSLPENWIAGIAAHTTKSDAAMLILPLRIGPANDFISHLQEVEFLSVMGVTAAMTTAGMPILCNGANLCFRKDAYDAVRKDRNDFHISSGDDLFLLHALKPHYAIEWIHNPALVVETRPQSSWRGLFAQRLRWMGKTARMTDAALRYTAWLTFAMNALLLLGLFYGISRPYFLSHWILVAAAKTVVDGALIISVGQWMCIKRVKRFYVLLIFLYPVYATLFPLISIAYKPRWKDRTTNIA